MNQQLPAGALYPRTDSTDLITIIIEVFFSLFGVLGMGWLYTGNIAIGVALLLFSSILILVEVGAIIGSAGVCLCVLVPANIAIGAISGLRARDFVRRTQAEGSILRLGIAVLVVVILIAIPIFLAVFFGILQSVVQTIAPR